MLKKLSSITLLSILFVGCASSPKIDSNLNQKVKTLTSPAEGKAGIYVIGASVPRDLWLDGQCLGTTGKKGFFYQEVLGGSEYIVSTESEFSPNHLTVKTEPGKFYYVQQYTKPSLVTVSSDVKLIDEVKGKQEIAKYSLVTVNKCYRKAIKLPR